MRTMLSIFTITFFLNFQTVFGQDVHFIKSGVIEFNKTANMFVLIKKNTQFDPNLAARQAYDKYVKDYPQFNITTSKLIFDSGKSIYKPTDEVGQSLSNYFEIPIAGHDNIVYVDFNKRKKISQKNCLGETFLIFDSLKNIKWKITDETREIAGLVCRRANGIILDSVYVVAFYTNQIPVPSGPCSFSGLPGMILGIALPHENVTWFATRISERTGGHDDELIPPAQGKIISDNDLRTKLKSAISNREFYLMNLLKTVDL